jgi:cell division protein ZapE
MDGGKDATAKPSFAKGRIITPGTEHQLGAYGLFPPSPVQRRTLMPATLKLSAKNAEPDLLWISFGELCTRGASAADYEALARRHGTWVIDGVPAQEADPSLQQLSVWDSFSTLVEVLYAHDVTVFLVGTGLSADLARADGRLALLEIVESADVPAVDPASGS